MTPPEYDASVHRQLGELVADVKEPSGKLSTL
jgi:hypothetical protein